jgi:hypothetical protein
MYDKQLTCETYAEAEKHRIGVQLSMVMKEPEDVSHLPPKDTELHMK